MRVSYLTAVLLAVTALTAGCLSSGSLVVTMAPGQVLDDKGRIFLDRKSPDTAGFQDELEHRLLKAGFEVRPEIFIKNKDESVLRARAGKSFDKDYVLEYRYHTRRTFLVRRLVVDRFEGKMLSRDTGKKVMEVRFEGKKSVRSFLEEFVEKMTELRK